MHWLLRFVVMISCVVLFSSSTKQGQNLINVKEYRYASRMWYTKPSVNWNEALPIGNGRLGAMVFGGIVKERVSLNEQTLWSGAPRDGNNPNAKKYLPLVRKAALEGRYKEADSLSKFMQGPWTESYMPMGDLLLSFQQIEDSSN